MAEDGFCSDTLMKQAADAIEKLLSCLQYAINWISGRRFTATAVPVGYTAPRRADE
jgi:hypothetical protein